MTLDDGTGLRERYLNLTDAERITLVEVAKYESGPMPPHGDVLLASVRDWSEMSTGRFWDYGVAPLVEQGLVERHKDGQARRYTLTEDGRRTLAAGRDLLSDVLEELSES